MKNIYLLHCFPVPYRNHLFAEMQKISKINNFNLIVHFFASNDPVRPTWNYKSADLTFNHKFWKPFFSTKSFFHFNPNLLLHIFRNPPHIIILGGLWSSINNIIIALFLKKSELILWDETNRFDLGFIQNIKSKKTDTSEIERYNFPTFPRINFKIIKVLLLKRIHKFAIPGKESYLFYTLLLGEKKVNNCFFMYLPNLIDENLFKEDINKNILLHELEITNILNSSKKIAYWPARFIPEKGILNFLHALNGHKNFLKDWNILLVGHGPLGNEIKNFIKNNGFSQIVKILNVMPYEKAKTLYSLADLFIMPSLSDSNPLSVIEAIHSSLPIIVSNRIGNLNEVLIENLNGVSVDPFSRNSLLTQSLFMFSKSKKELKKYGEQSKYIANTNFSSSEVISSFFSDLKYNRSSNFFIDFK